MAFHRLSDLNIIHTTGHSKIRYTDRIHINECPDLKGKSKLGDLDVDERILLKCNLWKKDVRMWTGFIWISVENSGGMF
jgi:hypothetical protein